MKRKTDKVDFDRRAMLLGLAGASALLMGKGSSAIAQEAKGVERKVFKEAASMIPGYPKVQLRQMRYQPGASTTNTMKNAMICECTEGALEITQDNGKPWVAKKGDIWTCNKGTVEGTANKGNTPTTMRVLDLLAG